MSVFLSVSMVLSLLSAQGVEEARSEFLLATTAAQAEENLGENTDPGGGNNPNNTPAGGEAQESPVPEQNTNENQNDDDQNNNTDGNVTEGNDTNGNENQQADVEESDSDEGTTEETTEENVEANKDSNSANTNSDSSNADVAKPAEIPTSENLADFITKAVVEGAQEQDGKLNVKEGENYTAKLTFAERADKQFANNKELTYALPQGFIPAADQPASHDALYITYDRDENGEPLKIELCVLRFPTARTCKTWAGRDGATTGAMSGTSGRSLRLEAIQIELTGDMANWYDVWYRVHAQNVGWMGWACNGAQSGTAGYSRRLEGIQILLVPKGAAGPDSNYLGIRQDNWRSFIKKR